MSTIAIIPNDLVRTQHIFPPIPIRHFDWVAWIDGREEDKHLYGYGQSEEQALLELHENWNLFYDNDQ